MSSSIHSAMHHRLSVPSWILAAVLALVLATGAIAIVSASGDNASVTPAHASASSLPEMPTSCVDARIVGHC